ncbi:MAG: CoA-binding protein [Alphaproteobacteria bacterium]|nr:CoA-binding protein [Alphaproteobacteria bacterium]
MLTARADVEAVLRGCRTAVVLGAHPERFRPAFYVPEYMHQQGMRVVGVNPGKAGQVLWDEPVRAALSDLGPADLPDGIDILDVFRRSADVPAHVPEILAMPVRPRCVWLQLGIRNDAAAAALVAAGIDVVQDRCILADHRAWGLPPVGAQ